MKSANSLLPIIDIIMSMVATIDNQMHFESYVNKNYTFNPLEFEGIKVIINSK